MRKFAILSAALAIVAVSFYGCDDSPTALHGEGETLSPSFARGGGAVTQTTQEFSVIDFWQLIPCASDYVHFEGTLHSVSHVTINGNHVTLKRHTQPQKMKGYSSSSGDTYQGTGVTQSTETFRAAGFPYVYTYVNIYRMIGQGSGNNYLIHALEHVTVNSNGQVSTEIDNYSVECK